MAKPGLEYCHCGSKLYAPARYDGHGIFLTYACDTCWPTKKAAFREDIDERYDADEPIEDEDGNEDRYTDPENIYGLASIQQSIEEDRQGYRGPDERLQGDDWRDE